MRPSLNPAVARVLKRLHYLPDVTLMCVRWYVAYPLSLRHIEEMVAERGICVDHSTVHRWFQMSQQPCRESIKHSVYDEGRCFLTAHKGDPGMSGFHGRIQPLVTRGSNDRSGR
jgi:hypothetical protein